MKHLAVFASGNGSNAENIASFFSQHPSIRCSCFVTNNPNAFVVQRAKKLNLDCLIFNKEQFYNGIEIVEELKKRNIDFIVLAGFLLRIPQTLIQAFPDKIVNIHPALLPKFGGKGMYGDKVHQVVIKAGETQSGISIHFVNENYDEGKIIFQAVCPIENNETAETLASKIHALEYKFFPQIIEKVVLGL